MARYRRSAYRYCPRSSQEGRRHRVTEKGEIIMVALVEAIARSLVDQPDQVVVREIGTRGDSTVIELKVSAQDMGKVIGKQGRIAKALRTVVKAAAVKQNKNVIVEIVS